MLKCFCVMVLGIYRSYYDHGHVSLKVLLSLLPQQNTEPIYTIRLKRSPAGNILRNQVLFDGLRWTHRNNVYIGGAGSHDESFHQNRQWFYYNFSLQLFATTFCYNFLLQLFEREIAVNGMPSFFHQGSIIRLHILALDEVLCASKLDHALFPVRLDISWWYELI